MLQQTVVRLDTPDHVIAVGLSSSCLPLDDRHRGAACNCVDIIPIFMFTPAHL